MQNPRTRSTYASLLALALSVGSALAAPPEPELPMPLYPEEAAGESSIWLDLGGYGAWLTDRGPIGSMTPLVLGLGFAHRIGPARLGWRAQAHVGLPGDDPLLFVWFDLLSVEYVFAEGRLRPWARGALGVGLDLVDSGRIIREVDPDLGEEDFFSPENGPAAGFGITVGGGVDLYFAEAWFARVEGSMRAHGGAGLAGIMATGSLGLGWSW